MTVYKPSEDIGAAHALLTDMPQSHVMFSVLG